MHTGLQRFQDFFLTCPLHHVFLKSPFQLVKMDNISKRACYFQSAAINLPKFFISGEMSDMCTGHDLYYNLRKKRHLYFRPKEHCLSQENSF